MSLATVLSYCFSRWVKTTPTASSSATSCTAEMATVPGLWRRTWGSTVAHWGVQFGTPLGLMENSGIRWNWLSAPSGLMSTRYTRHLMSQMCCLSVVCVLFTALIHDVLMSAANQQSNSNMRLQWCGRKSSRFIDRHLVHLKKCFTVKLCWSPLIVAWSWICC